MKGKESLLLKWGTVKGWNFEPKSKAFKSFREFAKGMSASCMADRPDAKRRKTLCAVIDKLDGTIENDWTGKTMTKEEAKKYIMEYDASYEASPARIKTGRAKFCSIKCMGEYQKRNRSKENHPCWKGGSIKKSCLVCGKPFSVCLYRKETAKTCSIICRYKLQKTTLIGEKNHSWKGGCVIKKTCGICGTVFNADKSNAKRGWDRFCSRKCRGRWKTLSAHGNTTESKRIRGSNKYRNWRSQVFIRDNFTCLRCGRRSGCVRHVVLEAHHIVPFSKLLNEVRRLLPLYSLYEGAMVYTPLWDINNGATLCRECHNKNKKGYSRLEKCKREEAKNGKD